MDVSVTARDLMTANPERVLVGATVGDAVELLRALDVRHLPVVNEDGEVIGIVSDRDLGALPLANLLDERAESERRLPVTERMSTDVISVSPDSTLTDIADRMVEHKFGALPVTDTDGVLLGIVSYIDVLRYIARGS